MKSALGLHLWMHYINQGWSVDYKTPVKNANGEQAKCLALVNAHETRLRNLPAKTFTRSDGSKVYETPWEHWKGWRNYIAIHKRAVESNNINLDKPQKWKNSTI